MRGHTAGKDGRIVVVDTPQDIQLLLDQEFGTMFPVYMRSILTSIDGLVELPDSPWVGGGWLLRWIRDGKSPFSKPNRLTIKSIEQTLHDGHEYDPQTFSYRTEVSEYPPNNHDPTGGLTLCNADPHRRCELIDQNRGTGRVIVKSEPERDILESALQVIRTAMIVYDKDVLRERERDPISRFISPYDPVRYLPSDQQLLSRAIMKAYVIEKPCRECDTGRSLPQ